MFCPQCGTQVSDGARFCPSCGHAFGVFVPGEKNVPAAGVEPARWRRGLLVGGIVAAVVIMAVIGVGVWFAFFSPYPIDERTFSDPALRSVVATTYDANHDGQLSRDEGRAVTQMTLSGATSLSGLGRIFPNLASLTVTGGVLTQLDVSDLGVLASLDVAAEPLVVLDVSHNPELVVLRVPDTTQVTGLEATKLHESWVVSGVTEDQGTYMASYTVTRDERGKVTARSSSMDDDGSLSWEYAYDEQGRLASTYETVDMGEGADSGTTTVYTYDDAGRLVADECYDSNTAHYYTYDDTGRLVEMDLGGVNDVTGVTTFAYDDAGKLVSETYRYKSNSGTVTSYTYDGQGNLIQAQSYDETLGEVYETITYQCDGAGRLTSVSGSYSYDSAVAPVSYAYDETGRLISASATLGGLTCTAEVTYDERGGIAQIVERAGSSATTYTPSYTRFFVAEGAAEPDEGIRVCVDETPLVGAQRMALVGMWAVPSVTPAPQPNANPGASMVILF